MQLVNTYSGTTLRNVKFSAPTTYTPYVFVGYTSKEDAVIPGGCYDLAVAEHAIRRHAVTIGKTKVRKVTYPDIIVFRDLYTDLAYGVIRTT